MTLNSGRLDESPSRPYYEADDILFSVYFCLFSETLYDDRLDGSPSRPYYETVDSNRTGYSVSVNFRIFSEALYTIRHDGLSSLAVLQDRKE